LTVNRSWNISTSSISGRGKIFFPTNIPRFVHSFFYMTDTGVPPDIKQLARKYGYPTFTAAEVGDV
jgi:hypothetical protein